MSKKIGFISLGCAKNLTDTETMLALLSEGGYIITPNAAVANVIVVNTCAFIESAKTESIETILEMAEYKKTGSCELLIVTGCMSQRYKDELIEELPEVDMILGTNDYEKIASIIDDYYLTGDKTSVVSDENAHIERDLPRIISTPFYSAYIKIADGCDNYCTYCIIPKLRGKFKSRSIESIVSEAAALSKKGVKELILVAQDTACYGKDINTTLTNLISEIEKIDGIEWIRLQYCYSENITDELIDLVAVSKKVVKYIDMPLQHISDNILSKMGRKIKSRDIYTMFEKLRKRIPDVVIRTSIIVGFPGETDNDFNELKTFFEFAEIDKAGVFTYSREEDTPAYNFENQIDEDIKIKRFNELMKLQSQISLGINKRKIGKIVKVIIEDYDENDFCYCGRSYADTPEVDGKAYAYSSEPLVIGNIYDMKILDAQNYDITGEIVYEHSK